MVGYDLHHRLLLLPQEQIGDIDRFSDSKLDKTLWLEMVPYADSAAAMTSA